MSDLRKIIVAKNQAEQEIKSMKSNESDLLEKVEKLTQANERLEKVVARVEGYGGN